MNSFLVVARHIQDDFPVALFGTRDEAERYANEWDIRKTPQSVLDGFCNKNPSPVISVVVVEFLAGKPKEVKIVRRE